MIIRSLWAALVALELLGCGASAVNATDGGPTADGPGDVVAADVRAEAPPPPMDATAEATDAPDESMDATTESTDAPAEAVSMDAGDAASDATAVPDATAHALVTLGVTPPAGNSYAGGPAVQYTATAYYSDGSTSDVSSSAAWSSSDTSIATVGASTGLATPLKQGVAVISAALGGKSAGAALVVGAPVVTAITLSPVPLSIDFVCTLGNVTATATYSDGTTADVTAQATWASSDTFTATAGADGSIACVSFGMSTITCTFAGVSATDTVTCSGGTLVELVIAPQGATVPVGGTTQFTALATSSDGRTCDATATTSWQTVTPSVATIASGSSDGGVATGVSVGSTVVEATLQGRQAAASLLVTAATDGGTSGDGGGDGSPVSAVVVVPTPATVAVGCTQQMIATAEHTDGSTTNATSVAMWSSSSTTTATVAPGGLVTCVAAGMTTISASYGGQTGQATVTCTSPTVVGLSVVPPTSSMLVGGTLQYTAYALLSDNSRCDFTQSATWQSSAPSVASIVARTPDAGLATGLEAGTTQISASVGGQTANATVTVQ